jgi:hypothetical protein
MTPEMKNWKIAANVLKNGILREGRETWESRSPISILG